MRYLVLFVISALLPVGALEIEIRYDYDTQGFFNQAGSREAMEKVARFYEQRIHDSLDEIDAVAFGNSSSWTATFTHPGTGQQQSISNLIVPADTLIVYAGGRNLGTAVGRGGPGGFGAGGFQAWFDRIRYRGQSGAQSTPATDFGPWGGSITFNNSSSTTWHFQTDGQPGGSATDFVSVALHEMAHLLGFGTADSWEQTISNGIFIGATSNTSYGGPVPVADDLSHWQDDGCPSGSSAVNSLTHGSFATPHGQSQVVLMDPSSCNSPTDTLLNVMTDLDLAALMDIGWEITPLTLLSASNVGPAGSSFTWPSTSGVTLTLQRSQNLASWSNLSGPSPGDGTLDSHTDSSPPSDRAFYRLQVESPASSAPSAAPSAAVAAPTGEITTDSAPERTVTCPHGH